LRGGYDSQSTLFGCSSYTFTRASPAGTLACSSTLPCYKMNLVTTTEVAAALEDPDVKAALGGGTSVYGSDPRGCDGTVLMLTFGNGAPITLGDDCSPSTGCGLPTPGGCVPVPPGLAALRALLRQLDAQELAQAACAKVR
jgi:hypothetical protein